MIKVHALPESPTKPLWLDTSNRSLKIHKAGWTIGWESGNMTLLVLFCYYKNTNAQNITVIQTWGGKS